MTRTHHLIPIRISTTEWWTVCNDCGMTANEIAEQAISRYHYRHKRERR